MAAFTPWSVLGTLSLTLTAGVALAHDLARDEATLWYEPAEQALRGQITLDPHPARHGSAPEHDPGFEASVLAGARARLAVEVDGRRCEGAYAVRELWVPAGPTEGDIVMYRCELRGVPHRLRVHAGGTGTIVVSVRTSAASAAPLTYSTSVVGGEASTSLGWDAPSVGWRLGGAAVIAAGAPAPSEFDGTKALSARATALSGAAHGRLWNACTYRIAHAGGKYGGLLGLTAIGLVLGVGRRGRGRLRKR